MKNLFIIAVLFFLSASNANVNQIDMDAFNLDIQSHLIKQKHLFDVKSIEFKSKHIVTLSLSKGIETKKIQIDYNLGEVYIEKINNLKTQSIHSYFFDTNDEDLSDFSFKLYDNHFFEFYNKEKNNNKSDDLFKKCRKKAKTASDIIEMIQNLVESGVQPGSERLRLLVEASNAAFRELMTCLESLR